MDRDKHKSIGQLVRDYHELQAGIVGAIGEGDIEGALAILDDVLRLRKVVMDRLNGGDVGHLQFYNALEAERRNLIRHRSACSLSVRKNKQPPVYKYKCKALVKNTR